MRISLLVVLSLAFVVFAEENLDAFREPQKRVRRIVGGTTVNATEWPWIVSLQQTLPLEDGTLFELPVCGGTVIAAKWILTAAHCVVYDFANYTIIASSSTWDKTILDSNAKVNKVIRLISHPSFHTFYDDSERPRAMDNDIALLELEKALDFGEFLYPIDLPSKVQEISEYSYATVIGYGDTQENDTLNDGNLRETMIPLIPTNICEERYNTANASFVYNLTDIHICAGAYGHSPFPGDSGGPLMLKSGERWIQIGIVSFGYNDYLMPQFDLVPAVFTNVSEYCEWIEEETKGEAKCS